jgi:glucans biosynthesis protein
MSYRYATTLVAMLALWQASLTTNAQETFNFGTLKKQAEALATVPHVPPKRTADAFLKLDYDAYRMIGTERLHALWRDAQLPFWTEFFPAGFIYEYPIEIFTVDQAGHPAPVLAESKFFQFRNTAQSLVNTPGLGFSGFRLLAPLLPNGEMDEFLVFQGASYFRGRVEPYGYGLSSRGLAIDTGLPSPEEFPRYTKFWLERPAKNAKRLRLWALMDSPAEAGATQFIITPGDPLTIDVETDVWFRHHVQKVGFAPLTSMWMWDASREHPPDPRPEVHDSDGLLFCSQNGEWTWRPLSRPAKPRTPDRYPAKDIAGFGLLQRDRDPTHYGDAEAKYHQRPSGWVTPADNWGDGHIELLELPAEHEGMDNIGAYWVTDKSVDAGSHLSFKYRLTFGEPPIKRQPEWKVVDTRIEPIEGVQQFEVEFASTTPPTPFAAKPEVTCDSGAIESVTTRTTAGGRVSVKFIYRPADASAAHIQANLRTETEKISENWSYLWTRN